MANEATILLNVQCTRLLVYPEEQFVFFLTFYLLTLTPGPDSGRSSEKMRFSLLFSSGYLAYRSLPSCISPYPICKAFFLFSVLSPGEYCWCSDCQRLSLELS
jgi:hypothetical protein